MKIKVKSIRFKLTAWYTIAFVVATVLIFTAFYFATKQALFDHTDNTLTQHSSKIAEIVSRNSADMHAVLDNQTLLQEFSDMPGMISAIVNNTGQIISGSSTNSNYNKLYSSLYKKASETDKPFFENDLVGNSKFRFVVIPLYQNSQFQGSIIVGHPIDVIEKTLGTLTWELGIVLLFLVVPGVIGGYIMARGAMKPIADISERIQRINYKNLDARVPNPETDDEIEELADTFNDLLNRLNDSFGREKQFIGDVAHELKTPLAILKTRIEIALTKDRSNTDYKDDLIETLQDVDKLSIILKDILDLAWSESDKAKMQMEKINFSELAIELLELTTNMASTKKIIVTSKIQKKIFISGTRDKLSRALVNLIDNSVKYSSPKGSINISLKKMNKYVVWQIKDNGSGISKEALPNIFDRFYRSSKNKKIQGSGLGLAIAQAIILAHEGKIEVESKIGKGTIFRVFLPIV